MTITTKITTRSTVISFQYPLQGIKGYTNLFCHIELVYNNSTQVYVRCY